MHHETIVFHYQGSGKILQHVSTSLTGEKVNLGDFNQVAGERGTIIKLHASFMVLAWLLCANLGTFVARYCKDIFMVRIINLKKMKIIKAFSLKIIIFLRIKR